MAADKAWKLWLRSTMEEKWTDADRHSLVWVWMAQSWWIAGGSAEKKGSDLTQAGPSEGLAVCPCLPCPQWGPRRTFLKCLTMGMECKDHFNASNSSCEKDHNQSWICQLSFYYDVLIWHCRLPEEPLWILSCKSITCGAPFYFLTSDHNRTA